MSLSNGEERLQQLVHELADKYPFYRNWQQPIVRFEDFPIVDKFIVNEHREQLQLPLSVSAIESFTSGSTGIPFKCVKSSEEQMKLSMAIHRHRRKWGLPTRYRSVLLGNMIFSHPKMVSHFANQIAHTSPHMIQGRCSAIYEVANYFTSQGKIKVPDSLLFVQNWGESLQPAQRQLIEDVFKVPLVDYYGMEEIWIIAFSNKKGQLVIDEQVVHVEVMDPKTGSILPDGEIGDIVVTSFIMKSIPFVRYRSGDIGRAYREVSTNERILELLPFRSSQIKLPDRTVDSSIFRYFDNFYQKLAVEMNVRQFQMVQESITSFKLLVVTDRSEDERVAAAAVQLETLLKQSLFTENVHITIECVSQISPNPVSGKFHPFVSMIS
ncbi:hypothetical protein ACFQZT_25585 [Paenibacillus sp. GCM10027628]|uniref:hypothetical protein n=1 Tax=Paenibacillus sp. GCM10027628 TaxID=3273413 RepID=UPI0036259780